jgi:DTW domain-containing protein YfiP
VCSGIVPIDNHVALLILQHPQEQDRSLGTARLTVLHFGNAQLRIGLSWASLSKVLGQPADPARWAVLYLGSAKIDARESAGEVVAVDAKGVPLVHQAVALDRVDGVIVLDGTWSQAKALWWRNPWLLKCQRVVLAPRSPSRYGKLRYEPRQDSLSTLEAVALLIGRLENRPEIEVALGETFQRLLDRYRATHTGTDRPGPGRLRSRRPRRSW